MNKTTKLERRWILYDVGNSAFVMLASTIIPIYYKNVASSSGISAADSTAYFSYATSLVTIIVAILGPVLGSFADTKGYKKPVFTFFMMMGVLGCAGLAVPKTWLAFLAVYVIAKVGLNASLVFYDAMLGDVTTDERMDEVSARGYAWGYIGSCIPFMFSLIFVLKADAFGLSGSAAAAVAFLVNAALVVFGDTAASQKLPADLLCGADSASGAGQLPPPGSELCGNSKDTKDLVFSAGVLLLYRRCIHDY